MHSLATEPMKTPLTSPLILGFRKDPSRFHIVLIRSITLNYGESKEITHRKHLSRQITVVQQIAVKPQHKKFCFTRNSTVKAKHDTQVAPPKARFFPVRKKVFPYWKKIIA